MIDGDEIAYDLVKENLKFNIPLIFCNATNEKILQNHDGIKIYEPTSIDFIMNILNRNAEGRFGGGSVAHACISTAIYLGCNNIIFMHILMIKFMQNFVKLRMINIKRKKFLII